MLKSVSSLSKRSLIVLIFLEDTFILQIFFRYSGKESVYVFNRQKQRLLCLSKVPSPKNAFLFYNVRNPIELILDVLQRSDLRLRSLEVQPPGVVGVELVDGRALDIALLEILVIIEVTVVGGDGVEVAHVDGLRGLFLRQEGLVHLLRGGCR